MKDALIQHINYFKKEVKHGFSKGRNKRDYSGTA